eukprot:g31793.t1
MRKVSSLHQRSSSTAPSSAVERPFRSRDPSMTSNLSRAFTRDDSVHFSAPPRVRNLLVNREQPEMSDDNISPSPYRDPSSPPPSPAMEQI